jgi:hypothetical protein
MMVLRYCLLSNFEPGVKIEKDKNNQKFVKENFMKKLKFWINCLDLLKDNHYLIIIQKINEGTLQESINLLL